MVLPETPERVFTLAQFCEELRREAHHLRTIPSTSSIIPDSLQLLDTIVDKVLELVKILHEHDCGIGLLAPENILIFDWGNEFAVSFSDLGFQWRDPWAPTVPRWLESNPSSNPYAILWENPQTQLNEFDAERDLRILGRVFCSALLGRLCQDIPDADVCPETKADAKDFPGARRVWIVIKDIIQGELTTLDSIREALALYPLSQHFLGTGQSKRKGWLFSLGAAVFSVLVGFALFAMFGLDGKPPPAGPKPEPTGNNESESSGKPRPKQFGDLARTYETILKKMKETKNPGDYSIIKSDLINLLERLKDESASDASAEDMKNLKLDVERLLEYEFYNEST